MLHLALTGLMKAGLSAAAFKPQRVIYEATNVKYVHIPKSYTHIFNQLCK